MLTVMGILSVLDRDRGGCESLAVDADVLVEIEYSGDDRQMRRRKATWK